MSLVCTGISSVCRSYVLVCHPYFFFFFLSAYFTRIYSYIICMSLVCTRMSSVCHPYVTRLYSYVTRMSLVCTSMSSVCHSPMVLPRTNATFCSKDFVKTLIFCNNVIQMGCLKKCQHIGRKKSLNADLK